MSHLTKLKFNVLDISDKNYLSWILDIEIHLDVMDFSDTIKYNNDSSLRDRSKFMIFLHHHLRQALKTKYLTIYKGLVHVSYVIICTKDMIN